MNRRGRLPGLIGLGAPGSRRMARHPYHHRRYRRMGFGARRL